MGSEAHVIMVGGAPDLMDRAVARIEQLEQRWSRFRPDSEVTRLNANAGEDVSVSDDTVRLVERAVAAWRLTGGTFDPTLLGAVVSAGYDRDFASIQASGPGPHTPFMTLVGPTDIEISGKDVRLPIGLGFDPGGIGKGLAADLVVDELRHAGAVGVCINLDGDLRVDGTSPTGASWTRSCWTAEPGRHPARSDARGTKVSAFRPLS